MLSDLPRMFVIGREAPPKCGNRSTVPQVPTLVDAAVRSQRCGATLAHRPVTEAAQDASTRFPAAVRPRQRGSRDHRYDGVQVSSTGELPLPRGYFRGFGPRRSNPLPSVHLIASRPGVSPRLANGELSGPIMGCHSVTAKPAAWTPTAPSPPPGALHHCPARPIGSDYARRRQDVRRTGRVRSRHR